jgi:hypothetical protein
LDLVFPIVVNYSAIHSISIECEGTKYQGYELPIWEGGEITEFINDQKVTVRRHQFPFRWTVSVPAAVQRLLVIYGRRNLTSENGTIPSSIPFQHGTPGSDS